MATIKFSGEFDSATGRLALAARAWNTKRKGGPEPVFTPNDKDREKILKAFPKAKVSEATGRLSFGANKDKILTEAAKVEFATLCGADLSAVQFDTDDGTKGAKSMLSAIKHEQAAWVGV